MRGLKQKMTRIVIEQNPYFDDEKVAEVVNVSAADVAKHRHIKMKLKKRCRLNWLYRFEAAVPSQVCCSTACYEDFGSDHLYNISRQSERETIIRKYNDEVREYFEAS